MTTVADIDQLADQIIKLRAEADQIEETLKEKNKAIIALEGKMVEFIKERGDSYISHGHTFSVREQWRVNLPRTDQDKLALFEHLRQRGIFEKFATVNSNSLNSLFMADWEEAKQKGEGMTFTMPGLEAPKLYEKLSLRSKK